MTLTQNGKDYIAKEWGINGCYVPVGVGLAYKAIKTDGTAVIGDGDTAGIVQMIIMRETYTRIEVISPKTQSYTYTELFTANDGINVDIFDVRWVALNDGYISPEQYCLGLPPICTPKWVCETPLNGYENDGCGNRRLNSVCNSDVPPSTNDATAVLMLIAIIVAYLIMKK